MKMKDQGGALAARLGKSNKVAMNCHLILVSILTVAYLFGVVKGEKTIPYFLCIVLKGCYDY